MVRVGHRGEARERYTISLVLQKDEKFRTGMYTSSAERAEKHKE